MINVLNSSQKNQIQNLSETNNDLMPHFQAQSRITEGVRVFISLTELNLFVQGR